MTGRFFHLQLRTNDTEDARSFYADVLGDGPRDIAQLDEGAVARGARPHWLGCLEVEHVDDATAALLGRGATALGPKRITAEGLELAIVRGPGTAVVAVAKPARGGGAERTEAVWYQLNAIDVERAKEDCRTLFGWWFGEPIDLGEEGVYHPFAWHRGGAPVGWMTDIFRRTGWHAHWLFHFAVSDLEASMRAVRSGGGYVTGPFSLGGDERVAVCDDSQSAAFAIVCPPLARRPPAQRTGRDPHEA
jgi:predicted enzyme related to lactoylglutathione lyase